MNNVCGVMFVSGIEKWSNRRNITVAWKKASLLATDSETVKDDDILTNSSHDFKT